MCYTIFLNTIFHTSGFLYNTATKQILLLQSEQTNDTSSLWSMLEGESKQGEDAQATFYRIIKETLNLKLELDQIHTVYDYFNDTISKINFVFYAEVGDTKTFKAIKGSTLNWIDFSQTSKLLCSPHTKQDIIVGERVINLKKRLEEAKIQAELQPMQPIP